MAVSITDADAYIALNCIVIGDWMDADAASKQRMLNVAGRTLSVKYPKYTIPDTAVYEFSNVLATVFNDTNKLAQEGVTNFALTGTASFSFKDDLVRGPGADLAKLIPQSALDLISAENGGIPLSKRNVGWSVM
ncbi:hypothetical protein [Paenibacillus agricola]|uniref:Uncharacterized protein n=1 Tax=Paenibacillus agricola TaxID=2716264 RepID=A0ABX0JAD0_9BACL|nr:hypothetical protein [Paenibacillus agricola]NHN31134.1 hypothetical protein [Paenibacillus agricola]